MNVRSVRASRVVVCAAAAALFLGAALSAPAEGFRSITTVTGDYYFPNSSSPESYYIESDEVLLKQVMPALTVEARVTRDDFTAGSQNIFFLGPVVSFTPTIYAVAVYGLGFSAAGNVIHEVDAGFNWETDTSAAFINFKGNYFTSDLSWYVLPSIGGKFHLLPALGMFGEWFMSWDNNDTITGAFWGQADYTLTPVVTLLGGFTVSFSRDFGWSLIAGVTINITENVALKYTASFLSNVVEYQVQPQPTTNYGVKNLLSLDWKF